MVTILQHNIDHRALLAGGGRTRSRTRSRAQSGWVSHRAESTPNGSEPVVGVLPGRDQELPRLTPGPDRTRSS